MIQKDIQLSPAFKTQTTKAISSIVVFSMVYLIIFLLAIALTVLCVYGGIMLVLAMPRFITIALGIGLASMGFLILIFLLKFIFKSNKIDRSHLMEVRENDQPELFKLIRDIVQEVGTRFPKKVYLSGDVNASVFYDSNFWSMFLPIKKNLQIGLGLVNSVNREELKAILAHEFGHFSQRTMKVGSYVYNVNQVIFNMLYENESYDKAIQDWANASGYFSIFVILAVKIIQGVQWILQLMYQLVNKNYLGLSREMEFHADEIAANVTGYEPLKNALLRMNLADHSFNSVLSFYEGKISENIRSTNIFKEQAFILNFLAAEDKLPIRNELPLVTVEALNKFNKSKLIIEDQWASHPSTEDRVVRLEQTNITLEEKAHKLANELFGNIEPLQEAITDAIFKDVKYEDIPRTYSFSEFQKEYVAEFKKNAFSKVFNGYYDNRNPVLFELNEVGTNNGSGSLEELYSDEMVNLNYTAVALQNDSNIISQIADKSFKIKTFDYDGKKYKQNESKSLLKKLMAELESTNQKLKQNDIAVFQFFRQSELSGNNSGKLAELYRKLFDFEKEYDSKIKVYVELTEQLQFVNFTTPFDEIRSNFSKIKPIELKFQENIKALLEDKKYSSEITAEMKTNFEKYLSDVLVYFGNERYFDNSLEILFTALNNYAYLLSKGYFLNKKELLDYKVRLLENQINRKVRTA